MMIYFYIIGLGWSISSIMGLGWSISTIMGYGWSISNRIGKGWSIALVLMLKISWQCENVGQGV